MNIDTRPIADHHYIYRWHMKWYGWSKFFIAGVLMAIAAFALILATANQSPGETIPDWTMAVCGIGAIIALLLIAIGLIGRASLILSRWRKYKMWSSSGRPEW